MSEQKTSVPHNQLSSSLFRVARLALFGGLVFALAAGVSYAQTWNAPGGAPPTGQMVLLNTGATQQTKTGNFWANSIGTTNGYCIGLSCISSWSSVGASTCTLDRWVKEGYGSGSPIGSGCPLSAGEQAAGWFVLHWDNCNGVRSRDCAGPSHCHYGKFNCDAGFAVTSGTFNNANYDMVAGPPPPPGGTGGGTGGGGDLGGGGFDGSVKY